MGLDQLKIKDNVIKAAISNPPTPKPINSQINNKTVSETFQKPSYVIDFEGKRRRNNQVDRKTQILLPRSLCNMKIMDTTTASTSSSADAEQSINRSTESNRNQTSFSNEDFRRFLDNK